MYTFADEMTEQLAVLLRCAYSCKSGGSLPYTKAHYYKIAVLSHIMIFVLLRNDLVDGTMFKKGSRWSSILPALATIDLGGSVLFIFGVGLIILATTWGGATYPWSSPQVLAPLIIGAICFTAFFVYEYLLEPGKLFARIFPKHVAMVPYSLFERRDTIWLAIVNFSTGVGK